MTEPTSQPPSDPPSDRFSSEERITANLRFRSLPAAQRTLLGLFAFVPPRWRGPLVALVLLLLALAGLIALKLGWLKGAP